MSEREREKLRERMKEREIIMTTEEGLGNKGRKSRLRLAAFRKLLRTLLRRLPLLWSFKLIIVDGSSV